MTFEMLFAYKQASLKHYSPLPIPHSLFPPVTWDFIFVQSPYPDWHVYEFAIFSASSDSANSRPRGHRHRHPHPGLSAP